jgi:hypothetical protein
MKNPLGIRLTESVIDEKVSYAEYAPKAKKKAPGDKQGAYAGMSPNADHRVVANAPKLLKALTPKQLKQIKSKSIGFYRALIAASQGMTSYRAYIQSLYIDKKRGSKTHRVLDPKKRDEDRGAENLWSNLRWTGKAKKVRTPIGEITLAEDSPLEAPVATYNRHARLMSPATRELVLRSRMTEIDAFAADRGYNPALVAAVAEVAMRTGRIPELRQYGFSGDDAKAVKHFISGDVLNNYAEEIEGVAELTEKRKRPRSEFLREDTQKPDAAIMVHVGGGSPFYRMALEVTGPIAKQTHSEIDKALRRADIRNDPQALGYWAVGDDVDIKNNRYTGSDAKKVTAKLKKILSKWFTLKKGSGKVNQWGLKTTVAGTVKKGALKEDADAAVAKNVCKKNKGYLDRKGHCDVSGDSNEWERLLKAVSKATGERISYGDYGVSYISVGNFIMHDDGDFVMGRTMLHGPEWTKDGKFLTNKIVQAAKKLIKRAQKKSKGKSLDKEAPGFGGTRREGPRHASARSLVKALAQSKRARKASRYKEDIGFDKAGGFYLAEVSPPGFSGVTKAMKDRHSDEIDNPYALAW